MEIKWESIDSPMAVKLDPHDTWSLDVTLSYIIAPLIKQLKATTHGAPDTDNADVPEELWTVEGESAWAEGSTHFQKWDWILDEIAWAFEHYEIKHEYPSQAEWDRVKNGIRLFAKYYQNLWD